MLPKTNAIAALSYTFKIKNKITTIEISNAQNNHAECDIYPPSSCYLHTGHYILLTNLSKIKNHF